MKSPIKKLSQSYLILDIVDTVGLNVIIILIAALLLSLASCVKPSFTQARMSPSYYCEGSGVVPRAEESTDWRDLHVTIETEDGHLLCTAAADEECCKLAMAIEEGDSETENMDAVLDFYLHLKLNCNSLNA